MTETLMAALADYGPLAMALILGLSCLGLPVPASLVMLAMGSMVEQGDADLVLVLACGIVGSVAGDQIGYAIGRIGGRSAAERQVHRFGAEKGFAEAKRLADRWGGPGVFFTRWLLSPIGPWVNLVAGVTGYSWARFTAWGVSGEIVWVGLYVGLGVLFSQSIQALADLVGDMTGFLAAGVVALALGFVLWRSRPGHHGAV